MDVKIRPDEELLSLNTAKNYFDGVNLQNNMNDIQNEEHSGDKINHNKDHHETEELKMDIKKEFDDGDHHQNDTNDVWNGEHSIDIKYEALVGHDEIIIEDNYHQEPKQITSKFPTTGVNSTACFEVTKINSLQHQSLETTHLSDSYVKTENLQREVFAVILVENCSFHERNFVCSSCFELFPSSVLLLRHKTVHSRLKSVNSKTLKVNKISHTIEKRFKCDKCDSQFKCVSELNRHKLTHSSEKPFKCDQCSYATRRAYDLSAHSVIHNIENTFKCDKCDFSTKRALTLKRHKLIHTSERPFKCDQCNYTAKRKIYVECHKRCIHWKDL